MNNTFKPFALIFIFFFLSGIRELYCQSRVITPINDAWKFKLADDPNSLKPDFDDSDWGVISVPHTWNNMDGQDGGNNYYRGTGWYRKSFHLGSITDRRIFIRFNSVNLSADVYINGSLAGHHTGGYSAFIFDITKLVKGGLDNVIAVRVSNDTSLKFAPLSGDFTFCGGITRTVELLITDNILVSPLDYASPGVYITPSNISAAHADINVKVLLANFLSQNATVTENYTIKDAHNNVVKTLTTNSTLAAESSIIVSRNFSVSNPVLWKGLKDPSLYSLGIVLTVNGSEVDQVNQQFGIRYLSSNPDSGIYLNGNRYPLYGIAFHEDRKNKGRAISDADRKQDLDMLKETGLNFVRLAHYQHGQITYNYCDSTGIVVWTEIPLLERINSNPLFAENIKDQLRELIRQNYNHPSVCFWGLYNELYMHDLPDPVQLVTELNSLAKSLDSTRMTTAASLVDNKPPNWIPDVISFNRYYGWYYYDVSALGTFLNNRHSENPHSCIGMSEYGAGASINDHEEIAEKPVTDGTFHPEEYQNYLHEQSWKIIHSRPYVWASTVWVGFDFASDTRQEGDARGINDKGLITNDRLVKKDAWFFYKSQWSASPMVYITSRRFTQRTNANTYVKVYSNCDSVRLFVNNQLCGYRKSTDHILLWNNILLVNGSNVIKAQGIKNGMVLRDSCTWYLNYIPDDYTRINFEATSTVTPAGFKADKGNIYGTRGNGLSYGWNEDNTANGRERFVVPAKEFDTFIHLQPGGKNYSWDIAVDNGTYAVYVACGDPSYFDSHHKLMIENKVVLDGIPSPATPWITAKDTVVVTDGKLSVQAAAGGVNTKINFIQFSKIDVKFLSVSADQIALEADDGSHDNFTITSNTNWTVSSSQPWLTVDKTSGTGNASVMLTATANGTITTRSAVITISATGASNKTIQVTQAGQAIALTVSADQIALEADDGSHDNFTITSNTSWTVSSSQPWLTVDKTSGAGNASVIATATANETTSARTAVITISATGASNKTIQVTQSGQAISLSVSTDQIALEADDGSHDNFTITSNTIWTVSSSQSWLTVDKTSGAGNASVIATATANETTSARTAVITISATGASNKTIQVTQSGQAISLSVSTDQIALSADAGSHDNFTITSNTIWTVSSSQFWLTTDKTSGTGNAHIELTASANGKILPRIAIITVSGEGLDNKTIQVTQSGEDVSLLVSVDHLFLDADSGSTANFDILANTDWTIDPVENWVSVNITSGTGDTTIQITACANDSAITRSVIITITVNDLISENILITQSGSTVTVIPGNNIQEMLLYPNPVTDILHVKLPQLKNMASVELFSRNGELLYVSPVENTMQDINMNSYPPGVYIIKIISHDSVILGKVIKQ